MAAKTRADLLGRCSFLRQARPELAAKIHKIYSEWLEESKADQDPILIDAAWQKLDDLVEDTTIEDVSDVFRKES